MGKVVLIWNFVRLEDRRKHLPHKKEQVRNSQIGEPKTEILPQRLDGGLKGSGS